MTTHPACGKSWGGTRAEHCPACCETFSGTTAGDAHRVGDHNDGTRRCLSPQEMRLRGMALNAHGLWTTGRGDRPNPFAEARKSSPPDAASCPPHRSPDGMPDEVIAWRCTRCGEVVRE